MSKTIIELSDSKVTDWRYPESEGRMPPYIQHLWALLIAAVGHWVVFWYYPNAKAMTVTPLMVSQYSFALVIFIGAYLGFAGHRHLKAINAIDLLTSTVEGVSLIIGNHNDKDVRTKGCLRLKKLLLAVYLSTKGDSICRS